MELITIEDRRPFEFEGERIAFSDTRLDDRDRKRPRWLELTLYATPEPDSFVFHKANCSNVWHLASGNGHVKRPRKMQARDLGPDAVYCGEMPPPRHNLGQCPPLSGRRSIPSGLIVAELTQHTVLRCPDPETVIQRVFLATSGGVVSGIDSEPAQELMEQAAKYDPRFRGMAIRI